MSMPNKKSVLIVINSMDLGGAQKSLISFLKCLEACGKSADYDISLMTAKPGGVFQSGIPAYVRQVPPPKELMWLGTPRGSALLKQNPSLRGRLGKLRWIVSRKQTLRHKKLNAEQRLWENWRALVPRLPGRYDIAVSYMNGFPNYYVSDKVTAGKKVLWIHNEYQKLGYDADYDRRFYAACGQVITISRACADSFTQVFPEFAAKTAVLPNITLSEDVRRKAEEGAAPEFEGFDGMKVLFVGRLTAQKQFSLAAEAAALLKGDFRWLIVGEGPEREELEALIRGKGLTGKVRLIGLRENPYPYMRACDVFAQTSVYEGKSIVLDEAKLLGKPIAVTDYPTAKDSIRDGETGLIAEMTPQSVAAAVTRLYEDAALRERIMGNLSKEEPAERKALEDYIRVMME